MKLAPALAISALSIVALSACATAPVPGAQAPAPVDPAFAPSLCDALRTNNAVSVYSLVQVRKSAGDAHPWRTSAAAVQLSCPEQLSRVSGLGGNNQ